MKFSNEQYAQALADALSQSSPKDQDRVIDNFIAVLKDNRDLGRYAQIVAAYEELELKQNGISKAKVTFAREAKVNEPLLEELNRITKSTLKVSSNVDSELIGGLVIRVDDTLIDASVKGQLERLKNNLTN
jgi:F-type H+-transporting ATPase subunit delta